jgi:hypothetical protein
VWFPVLRGRIDRRILVNFRLDPAVLAGLLPRPFRPKVVRGFAMGGICLIRMNDLAPNFLPFSVVRSSENGALRFAVEWDEDGRTGQGVYIPERFTTAPLAVFMGQRTFPGKHSRVHFKVEESDGRYSVEMDGPVPLAIRARATDSFAGSQVFGSLDEASEFFRNGALGYSDAARRPNTFDGLELRIFDWKVQPLAVEEVRCPFFEDPKRFPPGSAAFDHALLMRGLRNEFHSVKGICCTPAAPQQAAPLTPAAR